MEFQQYFNPVGTQLATDAKVISNDTGLVELLAKRQALENEKKQQAILDSFATQQYAAKTEAAAQPVDGFERMIGLTEQTAKDATAKAQALSAYPKAAKIYQDQANDAIGKYQLLMKERQDKNEKQIAYLQNLAGTMTESPEGFKDGLKQLQTSYPELAAKVPFEKDADGTIPFTPNNARIAQNIYKSSVSQKQSWDREKQVADILDAKQDNDRAERALAQTKLNQDREAAQKAQELGLKKEELGLRRDERQDAAEDKQKSRAFSQENQLRDDYTKASKDFVLVRDAHQRVLASAQDPTAAGDLALIYNYMKVLDPGSTVREGEFATAQNAGGISDRVMAMYNKALKGERLSDNIRADFVNRSDRLYKTAVTNQEKTEDKFSGIAKRAGVNPDNVVIKSRIEEPKKAEKITIPGFDGFSMKKIGP